MDNRWPVDKSASHRIPRLRLPAAARGDQDRDALARAETHRRAVVSLRYLIAKS
jgi:hypothetical protein